MHRAQHLAQHRSQLQNLVRPELVLVDVAAASPEELFRALEPTLVAGGYVHEGWREAISTREAAFPTGLAFGSAAVALPHTDCNVIAKPYVCVVRPAAPIPFAPMGEGPDAPPLAAQLVFNLGICEPSEQVGLLQEILDLCTNDQLVQALIGSTTPEELYHTLQGQIG